jgi:hypothetical protein
MYLYIKARYDTVTNQLNHSTCWLITDNLHGAAMQ